MSTHRTYDSQVLLAAVFGVQRSLEIRALLAGAVNLKLEVISCPSYYRVNVWCSNSAARRGEIRRKLIDLLMKLPDRHCYRVSPVRFRGFVGVHPVAA